MGAKIQAFDIFQTPLSSHYPLPLKNFADFLNVCSANILVLTGLQHQYIGEVQGELNCLQHHAYSVKRSLFNLLE
jgi:hypothetical protein